MPSLEIILAIASGFAGIIGFGKGLFELRRRKEKRTITISIKGGEKIEIPADTPPKDLEKLIEKLQQTERIEIDLRTKEHMNERGFVAGEFFLYLVPGIIALLFAITFVYLLISNRQDSNYKTPQELSSAMTVIIGYFFGVGVSAAANKSKTLTSEDIKRLIEKKD